MEMRSVLLIARKFNSYLIHILARKALSKVHISAMAYFCLNDMDILSTRPSEDPVTWATLALHKHIIPFEIGMIQGVKICL